MLALGSRRQRKTDLVLDAARPREHVEKALQASRRLGRGFHRSNRAPRVLCEISPDIVEFVQPVEDIPGRVKQQTRILDSAAAKHKGLGVDRHRFAVQRGDRDRTNPRTIFRALKGRQIRMKQDVGVAIGLQLAAIGASPIKIEAVAQGRIAPDKGIDAIHAEPGQFDAQRRRNLVVRYPWSLEIAQCLRALVKRFQFGKADRPFRLVDPVAGLEVDRVERGASAAPSCSGTAEYAIASFVDFKGMPNALAPVKILRIRLFRHASCFGKAHANAAAQQLLRDRHAGGPCAQHAEIDVERRPGFKLA